MFAKVTRYLVLAAAAAAALATTGPPGTALAAAPERTRQAFDTMTEAGVHLSGGPAILALAPA